MVLGRELDYLSIFFDRRISLVLCDKGTGEVAVCEQGGRLQPKGAAEQRFGFGIALLMASNDPQQSQRVGLVRVGGKQRPQRPFCGVQLSASDLSASCCNRRGRTWRPLFRPRGRVANRR